MTEKSHFKHFAIILLGAWLVVFVLVPNLLVLAASFLTRDEVRLVAPRLSLESYLRLADPLYLRVFAHSVLLAALATLLCLLVGYPFAFCLARTRKGVRQAALILVIIPFWTNSLVRTYAIRTLLAARGLVNGALLKMGVIEAPLPLLYNQTAVILGLFYVLLPFMVLPLYAVIEKLDRSLLDAASDLGAGRVQTFVKVILPLTLPGIIAGSLLVFLPALGMFYVADLLGGAKDLLLGNLIKNQFLDARDWPFGAAASVSLILIMALLLGAYYHSGRRLGRKGLGA